MIMEEWSWEEDWNKLINLDFSKEDINLNMTKTLLTMLRLSIFNHNILSDQERKSLFYSILYIFKNNEVLQYENNELEERIEYLEDKLSRVSQKELDYINYNYLH